MEGENEFKRTRFFLEYQPIVGVPLATCLQQKYVFVYEYMTSKPQG